MRQLAPFVLEAIGTFTLVFVGAGSVVATVYSQAAIDHVAVALAHGLTIAVLGAGLGQVRTSLFNPAITAALMVTGRLSLGHGLAYVAAQLLGGTLGALALRGVAPGGAVAATSLGATRLSPDTSPVQGLGIEMALTGILVLVALGAVREGRGPAISYGAIAVGLTLTAGMLFAFPLTGASFNPARSLGPAIAAGAWTDWWVYWVGPILGAISAAGLYRWIFARPRDGAKGPSPTA